MGYIRVSTDGQAQWGAGLAAQRSAIRAECARRGFDLARIYEDAAASAKSPEGRPALADALHRLAFAAHCRTPFDWRGGIPAP